MLIRAVAAGWQQRTVMNIQLEKAFNEIKKVKQKQGVKRLEVGKGGVLHTANRGIYREQSGSTKRNKL
jgi:hypothetical protein